MAYSSTEGGFIPSSPAKKQPAKNVVFPLTCLEFLNTTTNNKKEFLYENNILTNVVVCGEVVEAKTENEIAKYLIDDSTGRIEVGIYGEDEPTFSAKPLINRVGDYIITSGKIKKFSSSNYVHSQRTIKSDLDHMMLHLIECAYALC
ncbi:hypothetical protein EIN_398140 [Entamoeba invadens IP1]|uniref:OB domain-containing protein n=1 Tax=Entamoeba invadens IP1 TaxID=370355 RepID=A0A0A1UFS6_ENTIV|nr:hypothetical protein EIN_398140 [Entamoeba invadens IP1]ELP91884.1 hypothetical protein EIN_398140 [Entamoeba invadens IP1]|eukprot:XP_004258655.1 hypothetical protein EIN_398140 [Entamoeba invadens IP1]